MRNSRLFGHRLWLAVASLLAGACSGELVDPGAGAAAPTNGVSVAAGVEDPPNLELPDGTQCTAPPARLYKLTPRQLTNTVRALVPTLADASNTLSNTLPPSAGSFSNPSDLLLMSVPHVTALFEYAESVAAEFAASNDPLLDACIREANEAQCAALVAKVGRFAFRRPLSDAEQARYLQFFAERRATDTSTQAVQAVVTALALSPHFHFRLELGTSAYDPPATAAPGSGATPAAVIELTPYEVASALSYLVSNMPPDAVLLDLAAAGQLATPEQLEAQARRLLAAPETAAGVLAFVDELFNTAAVRTVSRNDELFPDFAALSGAFAEETSRFVRTVLWQDDARVSTLLSAPYSVLDAELADYYGVAFQGTEWSRTTLPGQRAGLLTQASWLSVYARSDESDIVARGRFIREQILCDEIPPPPPTVNAVPPPPEENLTQRERIEQRHSVDAQCAGCHRLMDPLGYAFESFDAAGRFRELDQGRPIDSSGFAQLDDGSVLEFADAAELAQLLGQHAQVQSCFAERFSEFAWGRDVTEYPCIARALGRGLEDSGGNLHEMLVALIKSPTFIYRSALDDSAALEASTPSSQEAP